MKKHGRGERRENQTKGFVSDSHADLPAREHEPVLHIIADVIIGLILVGVLLIVKLGFEQLPISQSNSRAGRIATDIRAATS